MNMNKWTDISLYDRCNKQKNIFCLIFLNFLEWVKFFQLKHTMTNHRLSDLVVYQQLLETQKNKTVPVPQHCPGPYSDGCQQVFLHFCGNTSVFYWSAGIRLRHAAKGPRQELEPWCRFSEDRVSVHGTRAITTELMDAWVQPWFDAEINPLCSE